MTTKGAKKRAKREARRKLGAVPSPQRKELPRTPSGQLSRSMARYLLEEEEEKKLTAKEIRENLSTGIAARMRHFDCKEKDAADPLLGSAFGILRHRKIISYGEYEAGCRWGEIVWRYYHLMGFPWPTPKAIDYSAIGKGGHDGEESESRVDAVKKAAERFMEARVVVQRSDRPGRPCENLLRRLVLEDESTANWNDHMIDLVRATLRALRDHFGIPEISDEKPAKAEETEAA